MSAAIFSGKRVLVLEDEPIIAMMIEDLLMEAGAIVLLAGTLPEAEGLVQMGNPEFAILDVNIRNEQSYGLAAVIRELGIPLAFASGYGDGAHPAEFAGIPTVSKPYDLDLIAAAFLDGD